ncbi:golgin subfamily B member 1-like, partial [Ostrinia nubilalis]|uniref:golgin subfamily B member 1-like n=1 Tax=Ostrinia nubilalis TaxID=29057 RepID=UPI00308232A0
MSFITKRERVFNEYDLFDLPPRNEGKLKAYASCTDARAWSHFCSDKTEHLVEIIKRNNETCRTKYVPTNVIVDTLMVAKNAEIDRLRRRIEEFEQMLAAYDQLDLTCDQKCEIANAHAAIKAANKELDEMCLDLDLSGFTEVCICVITIFKIQLLISKITKPTYFQGMDSDAFETGKSRGDEPCRYRTEETMMSKGSESAKSRGDEWNFEKEATPRMETKSNQAGLICICDASTHTQDPRIQEMQDVIISKDAKLCAMQNTIAVMENDVCEPYCIYAHIYTALEKIFGVLCQNDKYKLYLSLMTAGKDTRCIDIKGKILYKLKVLEKFSMALIAPCSQEMRDSNQDCACLRAEVVARLDFAPLAADNKTPSLDNKRAQLVADIMEHDEMKEILSKDSASEKNDEERTDDACVFDTYSIDTENLKRLKNLQENYDDLMTCYEKLKFERDSLQSKCRKYEELEKEFDDLKDQLREYNALWTEKEHYRKRSIDIDSLKEQYLVLADETSNLETQLKAECEINHMKSITIEELRSENIALERKLNEALIAFEKEKNAFQCKLKETECTVMCQEQQIKSLSVQIDRLLEHSHDKLQSHEDPSQSLALIDEIESLKEQIKNLKDTLFCSEEEKQQLHEEYQDKLKFINELKMEIEDWKSTYEKTVHRNDYLEKCADNFREEMHRLMEENGNLSQDVEEKSTAVQNLINIINTKSQEVKQLKDNIEKKDEEQQILNNQIQKLKEIYSHNMSAVEEEKVKALESLQLARRESQELLEKVKDYSDVLHRNNDMTKSLATTSKDYDDLKNVLKDTIEENKSLQMDLISRENNNSILLQEIQRLREVNSYAINNINNLQDQKNEYKTSFELTKKESEVLENKLLQFEYLSQETDSLKMAYENLTKEKEKLEHELRSKKYELEKALKSLQLCKTESEELIVKLDQAQMWEDELARLNEAHNKLMDEKHALQLELTDRRRNFESLLKTVNSKNELLLQSSKKIAELENELIDLKKGYDQLLVEKNDLQNDFDNKTEDLNNLYNTLEKKIEENRELLEQIKGLEVHQKTTKNNLIALQNENMLTQNTLSAIQKESAALIDKLKQYEVLESDFDKIKCENECLQDELSRQIAVLEFTKKENKSLIDENKHLQTINEDLEKSLINTRNQLVSKPGGSVITHEDILKELDEMKQEKLKNYNKIKNLINKLDESDTKIINLSEEISNRDDKIAILENHINRMEDEIRRLQDSLGEVIDAGENIRDNSFIKMDQSIQNIEAHHSKAAHNMKMELAKLQNENSKLEQQLSVTRMKTEESSRDRNKYLSQVVHLQNEREIIVTDIKQLELKSVGDSALSPEQCSVEDVLVSLDRIRKSLEAKSSKSTSLEQTILKVQTSSQILLTKADEAKKLVEKEKQKIIMEKEDAIRDRLNMEKRLEELQNKLDTQISNDAKIIKDLEANILNQKLMNEHTISKLKEELQESYRKSVAAADSLKEKLQNLSEEKEKHEKLIEKLNSDFNDKCKELEELTRQLTEFTNKPIRNYGIQVRLPSNHRSVASQTDRMHIFDYENSFPILEPDITSSDKSVKKNNGTVSHANIIQTTKPAENIPVSNILPRQHPHSLNEVQILTANVDPTFDFVKSSYLNYKIQRLSPGRLEQYSISNAEEPGSSHTQNHIENDGLNDRHLVDIYNRSIHSISSKILENEEDHVATKPQSPHCPEKSSAFTAYNYTYENSIETESNKNNRYKDSLFIEPASQQSTDADLFVIYKDSDSNYGDKKIGRKPMTTMEQAEMIAESVSSQQYSKENKRMNQHRQTKERKINFTDNDVYLEEEENDEDDSVKPKLNINLPRVENDSRSIVATSEGDKKSLDSYTLGIYPSPKQNSFTDMKRIRDLDFTTLKQDSPSLPTLSNDGNQYLDSYNSFRLNSDEEDLTQRLDRKNPNYTKNTSEYNESPQQPDRKIKITQNKKLKSNKNKTNEDNYKDDASHHKLSRVGADVYLIKSNSKIAEANDQNKNASSTKKSRNFALDYILDTVKREVDTDNVKFFDAVKDLRKSKSDERFNLGKIRENSDSIPSKHSPIKVSSLEYKTISSPSRSFGRISDKTHSVVERSVMAKIDDLTDYEAKIQHLTKTLENTEKDYKKRLDAIKVQYDSNIKNILNEHNQGVRNIQGLHEETLQDIIKIHENEIENLRTMSIEANRKAEKLEKENRSLKTKIQDHSSTTGLDEEPTKIAPDAKKRRRSRIDTRTLTKTNVEAFNVRPKIRAHGPCTCSLDVNVSDTIRNIFEQVDIDQRKMAEHTYVKYIANKILNGNVEALDAQELSFLHLKVCRTWKTKLTKEEALQKRIDSLESELLNKQRHAQQHIADLDRKVAEERRRLQEVREAVCTGAPVSRA